MHTRYEERIRYILAPYPMRVFIGSSGEQRLLVEWLAEFMLRTYAGKLEPVPWTQPWVGGRYTLENLLRFVESTDASILFWTPDDRTWYRQTERQEPRDNLVFEAGLFLMAHGRERTQLMLPEYVPEDPRARVAAPSDVQGLTWNAYAWADGPPEATGLPRVARTVCNLLVSLGPRVRTAKIVDELGIHKPNVEEVRTVVGDWFTLNREGIQRLAAQPAAEEIDILAAYRVGDIRRVLDDFKRRTGAHLRACFANMWDGALLAAYRRKYGDRAEDHIQQALKESITHLLGPCRIDVTSTEEIHISEVKEPPAANYQIRLTSQRITFGYYRVDDTAFMVPLDMKKTQNPAPFAWLLSRETMPRVFDAYRVEFDTVFGEAVHVYPPK